MRRSAPVLLALMLAACGGSSDTTTRTPAPAPASTPPPGAGVGTHKTPDTPGALAPSPRAPGADARRAMLDVLRGDTSSDRRVWFVVTPANAETGALGAALADVFREGGWQASVQPVTGMTLKAGPVRILVGDEQEPPAVDTARKALQAAGLTVETGTGYRAFYDEKKRENPDWPGVPLPPGQPYVVVIAPQPPAA